LRPCTRPQFSGLAQTKIVIARDTRWLTIYVKPRHLYRNSDSHHTALAREAIGIQFQPSLNADSAYSREKVLETLDHISRVGATKTAVLGCLSPPCCPFCFLIL
jgi:hypothetical protein